jgi:hypothetical protein
MWPDPSALGSSAVRERAEPARSQIREQRRQLRPRCLQTPRAATLPAKSLNASHALSLRALPRRWAAEPPQCAEGSIVPFQAAAKALSIARADLPGFAASPMTTTSAPAGAKRAMAAPNGRRAR